MKNRYIAICLILVVSCLFFSGCGGGNSIGGGHISFVDDSNPFIGTWICETTKQENYSNHIYRYEKIVFSRESFTDSLIDFPDYGLSTQHCVEISVSGTWYFLVDGSHIYIKPTVHNRVYINPAEYDETNYRNELQAATDSIPIGDNAETHYTYTMNDAKTEFTIRNVAIPNDTGTVWRRW